MMRAPWHSPDEVSRLLLRLRCALEDGGDGSVQRRNAIRLLRIAFDVANGNDGDVLEMVKWIVAKFGYYLRKKPSVRAKRRKRK